MTQPRIPIRDLCKGTEVNQTFLVRHKELRRTSMGATYGALVLGDATGTIGARWWKANEEGLDDIEMPGLVHVKGKVEMHKGALQLHIDTMDACKAEREEVDAYWPQADRDIEAMWLELVDQVGTITNRHLRALVGEFLDDRELITRFKRVPAGSQLHHSVLGGLLEHTLSVVSLARAVGDVYGERVNRDLLMTGALLHDIGKVEELGMDSGFGYTDRGNLVGHITIGVLLLQKKVAAVAERRGEPIPSQVIDLVQHLILSHHGKLEHGSPKQPMIPEALILHALDDMDTRVNMAARSIEDDGHAEASFTRYHRILDAKIYKLSKTIPE